MLVGNIEEQYLIRNGVLEDAESILNILRSVITEGDYFISVAEEFKKTLEQQRDWMKELLENERETLIVAEANSEIIGYIEFRIHDRKRTRHTGDFGIVVSKNYRGKGVGKLLLRALLDWAEQNPFIEKVALGVFSTNHRAIAFYKTMGFLEEGRKIKQYKLHEDQYADDILMYKLVK